MRDRVRSLQWDVYLIPKDPWKKKVLLSGDLNTTRLRVLKERRTLIRQVVQFTKIVDD